MEINEILEGKKTDNLEDTSASEEIKVEDAVKEPVSENSVPDLATTPVPTEDEVKDADLEVKPEEVIPAEPEAKPEEIAEQSETVSVEPVSAENVEPESIEENGVTEMPATKVFTQSEVNEMVGN